jgi:hypothetical protein
MLRPQDLFVGATLLLIDAAAVLKYCGADETGFVAEDKGSDKNVRSVLISWRTHVEESEDEAVERGRLLAPQT